MFNHYDVKKAYDKDYDMYDSTDCLPMPMYATAYVKFQKLNTLYNPAEGLDKGTIFPELYFPYKYNPMF